MRLRQRDPGRGPDENLISLINIVFLILIFFLVASTLRSFDPAGLELSAAQAEAGADQGPNVLIAYADGRLALAGKDIAPDALPARLASFAQSTPELPLLIAPDRALSADRLVEIAQIAQRSGISQVKLIVRKRAAPGGGEP